MREGRENRKKSTASVLVFDRRSHEAFGTLKNVAFLTYTVTSGGENGTAARWNKSGRNFNKSRTCFS
jgi:hypothetical protein